MCQEKAHDKHKKDGTVWQLLTLEMKKGDTEHIFEWKNVLNTKKNTYPNSIYMYKWPYSNFKTRKIGV